MPKTKKSKKKRKRKISSRIRSKPHKTTTPKGFFRSIGIKPFGKGDMELSDAEKAVEKLGRPDFIEAFRLAADEVEHDYAQSALMDFFHSDLDLVKIRYGTDFKSICSIATELQLISVPSKSRILDIGGGPGHLAFWMANIWDDCTVTVADKYSDLGSKWALEIGQNRVDFVDATLPDLSPIEERKFDIVVLSRVLGIILEESWPRKGVSSYSIQSYLSSHSTQKLLAELDRVLTGIAQALEPNGSVIVVESWSAPRILTIAKAFAEKHLMIDLQRFSPYRVRRQHSAIVFSRSAVKSPIQNIPMALATRMDFGREPCEFSGIVAESIRKLFGNSKPTRFSEYASDEKGSVRNEVLEYEGLALLYRTFTKGGRLAVLLPATEVPQIMENLQKMEDDITAAGQGTITAKYTAR
jgi:protein-L-isoaspartate O-methyltransferase